MSAEYLLNRDDGLSPIKSETERCAKISARVRHKSPYKNLLNEMDKRHILYTELAELLNLSRGTVSEKIAGKVKFMDKDIVNLVEIFNKPVEYLLKRDDGKEFLRAKYHETPFKNLLAAMVERNFSYTTLANLLVLSRPVFSNKMLGRRKFYPSDIAKLVEIFGKPAEYLLAREN